MDQEMLETIIQAGEKLQEAKKVIANKIIKLTEARKNKLGKLENSIAEKNASNEARFETISVEIENLKKEEIKLTDDVFILETEQKITQRNTNRTASHKSIFKIYILYEVMK